MDVARRQGERPAAATLFSEFYSPDNPNLTDLDTTYVKMAMSFRDANCAVCHQPEGHGKMNKLVLLQTPVHAASHIDAVLHEIRAGKMPEDDYGDAMDIDPSLKNRLVTDGEAFKNAIDAADAWER